MEQQNAGRVVVITGASSGVGRACARAFGRRGDRVALLARNGDALVAAANEIRGEGGHAEAYVVDVSVADAVEAAAAAVEARWGRIDVWVNNAMATVFAPVTATTSEEFRRVMETTYLGYVHGTQAALRRMVAADRGTIIQVGSALAYRSIPLQASYCAAKAAIRAFTDALRTELIHERSNVRVSQVHLPAVNTPQSLRQRNKMPHRQQPVPPLFDPDAIAEMIVWAAETTPREVLVGCPTLRVVWGQRLLPGYLERRAARDAAGFVAIDDELRTSNPRIFAAGDVTGGPQYVYVAAAQGNIAAGNALAGEHRRMDYTGLPSVTFTSPVLASAGMTAAEAESAGHRVEFRVLDLDNVPRALANRDTRGAIKLVADADTRKILGVHAVAAGAGDLMLAATYAIKFGLIVDDLADTWAPYLTMSEALKLVAQSFNSDVKKLSCCAA